MLPTERKQRIVSHLKEQSQASVQALATLLETTTASVRRDLRDLEAENRIFRRHGKAVYRPTLVAATLEPDSPLDEAGLDSLVHETVKILEDARNMVLTGGPVLMRVVRELSGKTIATHDLRLALAAAESDNDVSLLGRDIDNKTLTVKASGLDAAIADYWFDVAVIEADGLDGRSVFVSLKNHGVLPAFRKRSDSLVVVGKSCLVGVRADRVAAPMTDVDVLLIDDGISDESERQLEHAGVELRKTGSQVPEPAFDVNSIGNVHVFRRLGPSRFGGQPARGRER